MRKNLLLADSHRTYLANSEASKKRSNTIQELEEEENNFTIQEEEIQTLQEDEIITEQSEPLNDGLTERNSVRKVMLHNPLTS